MKQNPTSTPPPRDGERGYFIDYFSPGHPLLGVRSFFATGMRRRIFDYFLKVAQPTPDMRVMDLGPTPDRTPDTNYFEVYYPYRSRITAVSIEDIRFLEATFPGIKTRQVPRGRLPFADDEFDILFSSAVLEHVGPTEVQRAFVQECLRVAKLFFITTPNRWFPMDAHTLLPVLHWLPQAWHQTLLRALKKPFWADTANLNLLSRRTAQQLFPAESQVQVKEFYLLGFPQNIVLWGRKA